jgi:hypothetical protein
VAAPGNNPGPRNECFCWTTGDGKFWFYDKGINEIWNYDPVIAQWTWIKGKYTYPDPSYGIKGVPASTNTPGALRNRSCWKDKTGNIWIFGDQSNGDVLWMFDRTTHNWTWMKGDTGLVSPRNGTYRTEDSSNTPGSLSEAFTWTDNNGDFWGMGGNLNDVWKFNFDTKNWVWMKETGTGYPESSYGIQGLEDEANSPGERWNGVTWVDQYNNLWLMGGTAYHTTLDELWRFNTTTLKWAWVRGNESTSYGIMGVTSPANMPPSRSRASAWSDNNGNLWMFGGLFWGRTGPPRFYNDLWKFSIDPVILAGNLINFNAARKMDFAELSWSATNENDIKGYNLQRKSGNDFISVVFINVKPQDGGSNSYNYSHFNISEEPTYYRLVQVNKSGQEVVSLIRVIEGLKSKTNMVVYPNPSWGDAIKVLFSNNESRNILLINSSGMLVQKWNNYTGRQLQLQGLRQGVYFLKVNNRSMELAETKKIIVAK